MSLLVLGVLLQRRVRLFCFAHCCEMAVCDRFDLSAIRALSQRSDFSFRSSRLSSPVHRLFLIFGLERGVSNSSRSRITPGLARSPLSAAGSSSSPLSLSLGVLSRIEIVTANFTVAGPLSHATFSRLECIVVLGASFGALY
ncbi:hypothetical protein VB005_04763 [Metarhizium brunneum]